MQHSIADENTKKISPLSPELVASEANQNAAQASMRPVRWKKALQQVLPIYIGTHIAFLALTYLSALFSLPNFSNNNTSLHLRSLLDSWSRWDTGFYTGIATGGYNSLVRMAFFPLYPLLERGLMVVALDPFVAGLVISNVATLGMFIVFYKLVAEDFGEELAWRSVLYLAIFPTAFFFAAAYNESVFLFFSILSFYWMRRGKWWLAGLAALFAGLTRSIAVCLFIPFAWEYLRQHAFQWRKLRPGLLASLGTIGGVIIFAIYGYLQFQDPLAFSHAQKYWKRQLLFPGQVFWEAYGIIRHYRILTFISIHTVMDLLLTLAILTALILMFVGPWKLSRTHWSYAFYAVVCFLVVVLVPEAGIYPLSSMGRFMLEIFPAFIILALMGKNRTFNLYYLSICLPLLAFWLLQWLTGGWIV